MKAKRPDAGDALTAWRALWWARLEGKPVPAWAMHYFERCAELLLTMAAEDRITRRKSSNTPEHYARIVKALELDTKGAGTVFARERTRSRNQLILAHVRWLTTHTAREDGTRALVSKRAAYRTVAATWNLSEAAVKAIDTRRVRNPH